MNFEEKTTWASLATTIGLAIYYFGSIGLELTTGPADQIDYLGRLGLIILLAIVLNVAYVVVLAAFNPKEAGKKDMRDKDIVLRSFKSSYFVLIAFSALGLFLAVFEQQTFFIVNALALGMYLASLAGDASKLIAYRRGF